MSMTIQIIIAVSLAVIALYFLTLTVLTLRAYFKLRTFLRYMEKELKVKIDVALEHLKNISGHMEDLTASTKRKVEDLTEILPELRDKLQELVNLFELVQEKLKNPLFNLIAALKVFSEKVNRWI
jgi:uncharacterized protein YoxC